MITGSITLNNLTEHQFNQISLAHENEGATTTFNPALVQPNNVAAGKMLFNDVTIRWNSEEGFAAALAMAHLLLADAASKAAV